jgi:5-methylcytosine-specific restriction enzyme A
LKGTFRNENGTYMKLMNLRRFDSEHSGVGLTAGGKLEEDIWERYFEKPEELSKVATAIRQNIHSEGVDLSGVGHQEADEEESQEGKVLTRLHRFRERDPKVAKRKKKAFLKEHGRVFCEVCGFNFEDGYGERGSGYIECHHIRPVSELKPGEKTKNKHLALLCSNCHRMVHRKKPWLELEELRALIRS